MKSNEQKLEEIIEKIVADKCTEDFIDIIYETPEDEICKKLLKKYGRDITPKLLFIVEMFIKNGYITAEYCKNKTENSDYGPDKKLKTSIGSGDFFIALHDKDYVFTLSRTNKK